MMSSSRIIKYSETDKQQSDAFFFKSLQEKNLPEQLVISEGFQPLYMNSPGMTAESAELNIYGQVAVGEPGVVKPDSGEDEMQLRIQEASESGYSKGRREAEESFTEICQTLSEAVTAVSGLRERLIRECEDDLLRLAIMVAKQIIRQEISMDRKILAQFVCEAMTGITDQNDISICFHPGDYQAVAANRNFYLAGIGDKLQITIKSDDSVSIGGCIVETQTGIVDASVETQLVNVFNRLMEENGHGSDESLEQRIAKIDLVEQYGAKEYASN